MSDRTAQARDAYWNTHPHTNGTALDMDTLRFGVEWADANPQPTTNKAVDDAWWNATSGGSHPLDLTTFLRPFGIKVVDDE